MITIIIIIIMMMLRITRIIISKDIKKYYNEYCTMNIQNHNCSIKLKALVIGVRLMIAQIMMTVMSMMYN